MRITDARTGRLTDIEPARSGLLRIWVHLSPAGVPFGLGDLRALLVTDVLFRLGEFNGPQVMVGCAAGDHPKEEVNALAQQAYRLGIHPPTAHADPCATGDLMAALGGPCDIRLLSHTATDDFAGGLVFVCGPATDAGGFLGAAGNDPLAMRLALLERPHAQPAELDDTAMTDAQTRLTRWRQRVAAWAEMPSKPWHPDVVRAAFAGFNDGLDVSAALAGLRRLETEPGVAAGSRFETYVYLDRILGLELPRDIGRTRP